MCGTYYYCYYCVSASKSSEKMIIFFIRILLKILFSSRLEWSIGIKLFFFFRCLYFYLDIWIIMYSIRGRKVQRILSRAAWVYYLSLSKTHTHVHSISIFLYLSRCYEPGAKPRDRPHFRKKKRKTKKKKTYLQCVTIKVEKDCKYSLIYISRYKYFI